MGDNNINIITWNINGAVSHAAELNTLVYDHAPDVLLLQDTNWHAGFRPPDIYGRGVISTPALTNTSGGAAILVRGGLPYEEVLIPKHGKNYVVAARLLLDTPMIIVSLYSPHAELTAGLIKYLLQFREPVIIGGDFNAKHTAILNTYVNQNGRIMFSTPPISPLLHLHLPTRSTHLHYTGRYQPSILDFFVSNYNVHLQPEVLRFGSSDHFPVEVKVHGVFSLRAEEPLEYIVNLNVPAAALHLQRAQWRAHLPDTLIRSNPLQALQTFTVMVQAAQFNNTRVTPLTPRKPEPIGAPTRTKTPR